MTNYLDLEINHNYRKGYQDGFADGYAEAWVPVTEATPKNGEKVLVYAGTQLGDVIDIALYKGGAFHGLSWNLQNTGVSHWMPLPGAPKKGEDDGAY